jgi:cell division protein ZapA (FtsZ GTPase activity inhibitor)
LILRITALSNHVQFNFVQLFGKHAIFGLYPLRYFGDIHGDRYKKVANELSSRVLEIKARDNAFSSEMNGILASLNTIASKFSEIEKILEQHHNNFCEISSKFTPINTSIENFQNDMAQRYAVIQRSDFDQQSVTNDSKLQTSSSSRSSPGSSSSSGKK